MKRYSIIHLPVWSFFSKALYRDVCCQWKGSGFAYLLLLLAVCWTIPIVKLHRGLSDFVDTEAPKIVSQIPVISVINGKASIAEPQPYYITEPDTGTILFVIDTTGSITSLNDTKAVGLLTERQVIVKKSDVETRTFDFNDVDEYILNQDMITSWLAMVKKLTAPILYVLAVPGSFIFRIIQLLIYAAIGLLFARRCKCEMKYIQLLRLAVVAITPCIIIKTILGAGQIDIPASGLWYFLGAMGFLFFGVKASAQVETPDDDLM